MVFTFAFFGFRASLLFLIWPLAIVILLANSLSYSIFAADWRS